MPYSEMMAFLGQTSNLRVPSFSMPVGLLDLAGWVKAHTEANVTILDLGAELYRVYLDCERKPMTAASFYADLLDRQMAPDMVGISLMYCTAQKSALLLARMCKERWPNVPVVLGGNQATNTVELLMREPTIDCIVGGEGELALTALVRGGAMPSGVIRYPMVQDLDTLPMPPFHLLDIPLYRKTVGGSIMFTRGCPFHCTFCASHTVHGRRVRHKSVERMLAETQVLLDLGFTKITIEDDLFAARKRDFAIYAQAMKPYAGRVKFQLPQGLSVAVLTEGVIDAMVDMGIDEAAVAIESGSQYVQHNILRKSVNLGKAWHILAYLRQKGFTVSVNFILGFPGETRDMMQESIDFMHTLDVDWVYIFHALPLPGSDMYYQMVREGTIAPDGLDWDTVRLGRRGFDTPEISAADLERLVYDTNIDINFFGNSNLRHGRWQRAADVFTRYILEQYPFHIVGRYCRSLAYAGMGLSEKAQAERAECRKWIERDAESKRLWERYGERMPNVWEKK